MVFGDRQNRIRAELAGTNVLSGINDLYILISQFVVTHFDGRVVRCLPMPAQEVDFGAYFYVESADDGSAEVLFLSDRRRTDYWLKLHRLRLDDWLTAKTMTADLRNPLIDAGPSRPQACALINDEFWIQRFPNDHLIFRQNATTGRNKRPLRVDCQDVYNMMYIPPTNTVWIWTKTILTIRSLNPLIDFNNNDDQDRSPIDLPELRNHPATGDDRLASRLFDPVAKIVWTMPLLFKSTKTIGPRLNRFDGITADRLPAADIACHLDKAIVDVSATFASMFAYDDEFWFCCGDDAMTTLRMVIFDGRSGAFLRSFDTADFGRSDRLPAYIDDDNTMFNSLAFLACPHHRFVLAFDEGGRDGSNCFVLR